MLRRANYMFHDRHVVKQTYIYLYLDSTLSLPLRQANRPTGFRLLGEIPRTHLEM